MTTTTISARIEAIAASIQAKVEEQLSNRVAQIVEARACDIIEKHMNERLETLLIDTMNARLESLVDTHMAKLDIPGMIATAEQAVQQAINSAFDRLAGITPPPLPADAGEDAREKEAPACDPVTLPEPEPTPEPTAQTDETLVTVAACSPVLSGATAEPTLAVEEVLPDGVEVALPAIDAKPARKSRGRKAK